MSQTALNLEGHYKVASYSGIAWYLLGYASEWKEASWEFVGGHGDDKDDEANYLYSEADEIEDRSRVRAVMVGDDRVFTFDVDELEPLSGDDYCHECGQIGCKGTSL
jgi:hypothetical protein